MDFIADLLLATGAFGAGLYCFVLSRRLKRFSQLEGGMGGAVALLSAQVDELTKAVATARETAGASERSLEEVTGRAEAATRRLEVVLAAMHDLPAPKPQRRRLRLRQRRDDILMAAE
ncbi:hypothetical protein CDV50_14895 [Haematobacter massiliensis]|uniref:Uncharacterized protein n=1 Tax=Haematobacter massiliensis TaxID=195105 RepID=A0A086Y0T7_9RHOB|nr:hypothetical protein [Haematobacter massiliensis]KFI27887.1 hypothetical protein CN97_19790 [Haematobacter massiliensis]OWJ69953.1 hypothetical protein CDV50_14895 [Haematobacter massiliensis]OWJ87162.1 hypothetical protein CDV51_07980 [Haematobacter massiliensis]QBJ25187.1 hypothetical protein HmaOT1_13595 [Haematobacter massiliensis]